jgi:GNAT superfamily N-acetyltransferase
MPSAIRAAKPRPTERLEHFREDPRQFLLLALSNGTPCGLVAMKLNYSLTRGADVARITALVVSPDAHGQGIGRRLLREVETLARRNRRGAGGSHQQSFAHRCARLLPRVRLQRRVAPLREAAGRLSVRRPRCCDHCPPSAVRVGPLQPKSNGLERTYADDARRAT